MSGPVAELALRTLIDKGHSYFHLDTSITLGVHERFAINFVCWMGQSFADFKGRVPEIDEEWLCMVKPAEIGRPNAIFGNFTVAHFGFARQRKHMDATDLLQAYRKLEASEIADLFR